jgi:hypothetical protein
VAGAVQTLLTHDWPDMQVNPHPPQLFESEDVSTQAPPHVVPAPPPSITPVAESERPFGVTMHVHDSVFPASNAALPLQL